jgi:hypothetical protein
LRLALQLNGVVMSRLSTCWLLLLLTSINWNELKAQSSPPDSPPLNDFLKRLQDFKPAENPEALYPFVADQFELYSSKYGSASQCPESASPDQLRSMFDGARVASFYTGEFRYFDRAKTCYDQLAQRSATRRSEDLTMFKIYARHRAFDQARKFSIQHPELGLPEIPGFEDSPTITAPSVISIEQRKGVTKFVRKPVNFNKSTQIVVISGAQCKFSRAAIASIEADPDFKRQLSGTLWVTPPEDLIEYRAIAQWNLEHVGTQLQVAFSQKEFEHLDMSQTPTFYFMRNGKIVNKLVGWRSNERLGELKSYVQELGIERH